MDRMPPFPVSVPFSLLLVCGVPYLLPVPEHHCIWAVKGDSLDASHPVPEQHETETWAAEGDSFAVSQHGTWLARLPLGPYAPSLSGGGRGLTWYFQSGSSPYPPHSGGGGGLIFRFPTLRLLSGLYVA